MVCPLARLEYENLKESIRQQNGIQIPIIINENNVVLDGYHRLKAIRELLIEAVPVLVKSFDNEFDEQAFVISTNLERRQLNDFQKAELASKLR